MQHRLHQLTAALFLLFVLNTSATVLYVDLNSTNPTPPYTNWLTAASAIQDAIDSGSSGDLIWVTNGVYLAGGKVMAGDLTNRVALDKALTVQSVNGPWLSVIQGAGATNGTTAVRCAWLTNGAVLQGFTLRGGATRITNSTTLGAGGGVWCASSNALVANCVIVSNNAASGDGGGAYQGTLRNSFLNGNSSLSKGYGARNATLINCTLTGSYTCRLTNCIMSSFDDDKVGYCCYGGLVSGNGNIGADPQLLPDGIHLAVTSPCRAAGTNVATGTDLDGEPWPNPPSIGCDQWQPAPLIIGPPQVQLTNTPGRFSVSVIVGGQPPFTCWWTQSGAPVENDSHYTGAHTTKLGVQGINPPDAGGYQVVASNAFGMATSGVGQVVIHYVNAAATASAPPYLTWTTAATNVQTAIDAASNGEMVLVTNGVYATGGKVIAWLLTNRIVLDKALVVQSLNGPLVTVIQGAPNGTPAVRCAWLTNGAMLSGFTLRGGATVTSFLNSDAASGGGVWCASANAVVVNCLINSNTAYYQGGGAYQGTFENCVLMSNAVALSQGGACYAAVLNNCTVVSNSGYAAYGSTLTNCISYFNAPGNSLSSTLAYCCTTPFAVGPGNITNAPLFMDLAAGDLRLQSNSPCINSGYNPSAPPGPDPAGNPRITGGTVDIGAYEFPSPASLISYAWLQRYGLSNDGLADGVDFDHDGLTTWQEWIAGTDPTNAFSALRFSSPSGSGSGITVSWQSVSGKTYLLQRGTNLASTPAFLSIRSNLVGQAGTTSCTDATATNSGPYFYRVGVQ